MSHPVFCFTDALVRGPGASAIEGLRSIDRGAPSYAGLESEHAGYCTAMRRAGLRVHVLAPRNDFPDSMFVEDPALVFAEVAIVLRPGAPSRFDEATVLRDDLVPHFPSVIDLPGPGFVDGGDVLVTPDLVYVGLSSRTNREGAEALAECLADLGRATRIVTPPPGVLHLKTACSLVDDATVLATDTLADSGIFNELEVLRVPPGEEPAANALRVNDVLLVSAGYPRTAARLSERGLTIDPLPLDNIERLDAGLSCLSLRWYRA